MSSSSTPSQTDRRVFVDFSLIDYRTGITGIPRVAYAYLEEGYAIGREQGFEVVPVYVRDSCLVDARPLLIWSNWRLFRSHPGPRTAWQVFRSCLYFALHVLRLLAVVCITPFFSIAGFLFSFAFFDLAQNVLKRAYLKGYNAAKRAVNDALTRKIDHRPGDILFMPAYWHDTPPGYYARLRRRGLRLYPMVHDILPITHPDFYESPWREQFRSYVFEVLRNSDHIYYISEATKRTVAEVNDASVQFELTPGTVVHHGFDFGSRQQEELRPKSPKVAAIVTEDRPFFLMVGSIEPKKNHLKVIAEFEKLWDKGAWVSLVIVGRAGWKDEPIRLELNSNPHLHGALMWLQDIDDRDLRVLYKHAMGLIQASSAEGFGLPLIEALAFGTTVLANDIPVFREIAGKYATFFDIEHAGDLEQKVQAQVKSGLKAVASHSWPTWRERAQFLYADLLARAASEKAESTDQPKVVSA